MRPGSTAGVSPCRGRCRCRDRVAAVAGGRAVGAGSPAAVRPPARLTLRACASAASRWALAASARRRAGPSPRRARRHAGPWPRPARRPAGPWRVTLGVPLGLRRVPLGVPLRLDCVALRLGCVPLGLALGLRCRPARPRAGPSPPRARRRGRSSWCCRRRRLSSVEPGSVPWSSVGPSSASSDASSEPLAESSAADDPDRGTGGLGPLRGRPSRRRLQRRRRRAAGRSARRGSRRDRGGDVLARRAGERSAGVRSTGAAMGLPGCDEVAEPERRARPRRT